MSLSNSQRAVIGGVGLAGFFLALYGSMQGWAAMWIPGAVAFCLAIGVLVP